MGYAEEGENNEAIASYSPLYNCFTVLQINPQLSWLPSLN